MVIGPNRLFVNYFLMLRWAYKPDVARRCFGPSKGLRERPSDHHDPVQRARHPHQVRHRAREADPARLDQLLELRLALAELHPALVLALELELRRHVVEDLTRADLSRLDVDQEGPPDVHRAADNPGVQLRAPLEPGLILVQAAGELLEEFLRVELDDG